MLQLRIMFIYSLNIYQYHVAAINHNADRIILCFLLTKERIFLVFNAREHSIKMKSMRVVIN
jgi:hypothetical protein